MIIFVKYGDEHSFIINPDSKLHNFYPYMKKKLMEVPEFELAEDEQIELYNLAYKRTVITNLRNLKPSSYVSDIVKDREIYVPVRVKLVENKQVADMKLFYIENITDKRNNYSLKSRLVQALQQLMESFHDIQREQQPPPVATPQKPTPAPGKQEKATRSPQGPRRNVKMSR